MVCPTGPDHWDQPTISREQLKQTLSFAKWLSQVVENWKTNSPLSCSPFFYSSSVSKRGDVDGRGAGTVGYRNLCHGQRAPSGSWFSLLCGFQEGGANATQAVSLSPLKRLTGPWEILLIMTETANHRNTPSGKSRVTHMICSKLTFLFFKDDIRSPLGLKYFLLCCTTLVIKLLNIVLHASPEWRVDGSFLRCLCPAVSGGPLKRMLEKRLGLWGARDSGGCWMMV